MQCNQIVKIISRNIVFEKKNNDGSGGIRERKRDVIISIMMHSWSYSQRCGGDLATILMNHQIIFIYLHDTHI